MCKEAEQTEKPPWLICLQHLLITAIIHVREKRTKGSAADAPCLALNISPPRSVTPPTQPAARLSFSRPLFPRVLVMLYLTHGKINAVCVYVCQEGRVDHCHRNILFLQENAGCCATVGQDSMIIEVEERDCGQFVPCFNGNWWGLNLSKHVNTSTWMHSGS